MSARPGPPVAIPLDIRVMKKEYRVVGACENIIKVTIADAGATIPKAADALVRTAVGRVAEIVATRRLS